MFMDLETRVHAICDRYPICDPQAARYANRSRQLARLQLKALGLYIATGLLTFAFGAGVVVALMALFGKLGLQ